MANYTMTFKEVIDYLDECQEHESPFPATYQLYDNTHKEDLESKIVARYYLREIGAETIDTFLLYFRSAFLEILPRANKMYEAIDNEDYGKMVNFKKHTVIDKDTGANVTGSYSNSGSDSTDTKFENTPYSNLPAGNDYATTKSHGSGSNSGSGTNSTGSVGTEDTKIDESTLNGMTYAEAVKKYENAIVDVDLMIIDYLKNCFMQIF